MIGNVCAFQLHIICIYIYVFCSARTARINGDPQPTTAWCLPPLFVLPLWLFSPIQQPRDIAHVSILLKPLDFKEKRVVSLFWYIEYVIMSITCIYIYIYKHYYNPYKQIHYIL